MFKNINFVAIFSVIFGASIFFAQTDQGYAFLGETNQTYMTYAVYGPNTTYNQYSNVLSQPLDILPAGFATVIVGGVTYYYSNGVFYQKNLTEQKYLVVPPPVGAVIYSIPNGYKMTVIGGVMFYEYNGVFYKRVLEGYRVIEPPAAVL